MLSVEWLGFAHGFGVEKLMRNLCGDPRLSRSSHPIHPIVHRTAIAKDTGSQRIAWHQITLTDARLASFFLLALLTLRMAMPDRPR